MSLFSSSSQFTRDDLYADDESTQSMLEIEQLDKTIKEKGSNPDLLLKRAQLYISINSMDEAVTDLNSALKFDSKHVGSLLALAKIKTETEKFDEATYLIDTALSVNPKNVDGLRCRAKNEYAKGNFDKAILVVSNKKNLIISRSINI